MAHVRYVPIYMKMKDLSGTPRWMTKTGQQIILNEMSHPHFSVQQGTREYFLLGAVFNKLQITKLKDKDRLKVVALFDQPVGEREYALPWQKDTTKIITIILVAFENKLELRTAYYGMALDKNKMRKYYKKTS